LVFNFIIATFDCQGGSQGGGISANAIALARNGVAPPLSRITYNKILNTQHVF